MQNAYRVASLRQLADDPSSNETCAANHQSAHGHATGKSFLVLLFKKELLPYF
jgi:hypothetical protein